MLNGRDLAKKVIKKGRVGYENPASGGSGG